jgi:hypothetical protein
MLSPASIASLYARLDESFDRRAGTSTGFDMLIAPTSCDVDAEALEGWRGRYDVIKAFQEQALALFKASLAGEADPAIARMVVGDLPAGLGVEYHRALTDEQHRTPAFFRTDEAAPGALTEVQCPGSGWDIAALLADLYAERGEIFGAPRHFDHTFPAGLAAALRRHAGADPVIHHLVDNASRPHGMRYLIQRTREEGIRYFGYDAGVAPGDCNLVRSHDFVSLRFHNFFDDRMARCTRGACRFDLPPSALFDGKLIMAWPFWSRTRQYFSDGSRSLFPHTSLITPDGAALEDGEVVPLDELFGRSHANRNYYVKYAGTDIALNWGSRAVFLVRGSSLAQRRELRDQIARDWPRGRHWVLQPSVRSRSTVASLTRGGEVRHAEVSMKWSAFYGPSGLLGILVFHRNFHKVHGSTDTVMSLVY